MDPGQLPGPTFPKEWAGRDGSCSEQSKYHEEMGHVSTSPALLESLNIWPIFLCVLSCILFASSLKVLLLEYSTLVLILTCRYFWVNSELHGWRSWMSPKSTYPFSSPVLSTSLTTRLCNIETRNHSFHIIIQINPIQLHDRLESQ